MKRFIAVIAFLLGLLAFHTEVHARCVTNTIFTADGRMMICTTCCYYSNCTTTCI